MAASRRREPVTRLRFVDGGSQFHCERSRCFISELSSLRPEHQTENPRVDDRALPPVHGGCRDPGEVVLLRAARSRAVPRRLDAACRAARRHRGQPDRLDRRSEPAPNTGLAMSVCGQSLRLRAAANAELRSLQIAGARTAVDPGAADGRWRNRGVADLLCDALMTHGHEVTLFAAPGFRSPARVHPLIEPAHPNTIGSALHESHHVARASGPIDLATARTCCWMRLLRRSRHERLPMLECYRRPAGALPTLCAPVGTAADRERRR